MQDIRVFVAWQSRCPSSCPSDEEWARKANGSFPLDSYLLSHHASQSLEVLLRRVCALVSVPHQPAQTALSALIRNQGFSTSQHSLLNTQGRSITLIYLINTGKFADVPCLGVFSDKIASPDLVASTAVSRPAGAFCFARRNKPDVNYEH